uniref:G protein-coupled receptor 39 n=2 Tax=Neolamprologus brichardi TaxID=32507 RepID=A0A3Q4HN91_NEOBR
MVSLACSDILVLLIGMPVELYSAIWFPFTSASGNAFCKIYNFLFEACSYATILNVATLSFERYIATCYPFRFKTLGGKWTTGLITFAWVVALFVALPLLITMGTQGHIPVTRSTPVQNLTFCTNLREHWVMYRISIFFAFIVYMIVLVCVAFMCRAMILVLKKPMGFIEGSTSGNQRAIHNENSKVKSARKQTIVFLVLIVGSLMVCWLPNQIRRLMMAAMPKSNWTITYFRSYVILHPVADTFFYLSSVLNPFLYNLSSRQFRDVFMQVLRCHLTIAHKNQSTVQFRAAPKQSLQRPLLLKSLRRNRSSRTTVAKEETPSSFTTFQSQDDSGLGTDTQTSIIGTEEQILELKNRNVPSESEI